MNRTIDERKPTMKTKSIIVPSVSALALLAGLLATSAIYAQQPVEKHGWLGTETIKTRFGEFEFKGGYPTPQTAAALREQLLFNRAVEVYLPQVPSVAMFEAIDGFKKFGAKSMNHLIIWEQLMDAQTLLLTANTETVYAMSWLDLKDGPMVIEAPPQVLGASDDMRMKFLTDIGLAGPDKGKGGK